MDSYGYSVPYCRYCLISIPVRTRVHVYVLEYLYNTVRTHGYMCTCVRARVLEQSTDRSDMAIFDHMRHAPIILQYMYT